MGIISLNRACEKNGIKMSTSRLFCLIPFLSFVLLPAIASASDLTSVITRPVPDGGHAIVAKTDAAGAEWEYSDCMEKRSTDWLAGLRGQRKTARTARQGEQSRKRRSGSNYCKGASGSVSLTGFFVGMRLAWAF
jgi:hypothetical protein